jgi:hypothetical protein
VVQFEGADPQGLKLPFHFGRVNVRAEARTLQTDPLLAQMALRVTMIGEKRLMA